MVNLKAIIVVKYGNTVNLGKHVQHEDQYNCQIGNMVEMRANTLATKYFNMINIRDIQSSNTAIQSTLESK